MINQNVYTIVQSEDLDLPYMVFWKVNGRDERAKHLGKKSKFKTLAAAQEAVHNATKYGSQNV